MTFTDLRNHFFFLQNNYVLGLFFFMSRKGFLFQKLIIYMTVYKTGGHKGWYLKEMPLLKCVMPNYGK